MDNSDNFFKEHDVVYLIHNISGFLKGTRGVLVHIYEGSSMFEVEFFDDENNTIGVGTIFKGYLKKK